MAEKKKKTQNKPDKVELAYEILAAHEQDLVSLDKKVEAMSLLVDKLKGRMGL
tara:strand:- start:185 stop:343 length:159 start_codon:yes stop_codon:yes gene_type:complete